MRKNLLGVQNLKTYFYTSTRIVKAVDGITLEIGKKEVVGLIGESGCGKSTVALSIMRLVPTPGKVTSGKIMFNDENLLELSEEEMRVIRRRAISIIFQDPFTFLNPVLKVKDQIAEVVPFKRGAKIEVEEEVIESLEIVGIPSASKVAEYYPHQLSGGMRQRVLVAMAFLSKPSLIIADEPTTALDATIQQQIMDLISSLIKESGISLLLVTHNLGLVADICDKVYVMYAGKIVEQADVFTLFEKPLHPYTKKLLQSVLSVSEFKEKIKSIPGTVPDLSNLPPGCRFHTRCDLAKTICSQREPRLVDIERGHTVACLMFS